MALLINNVVLILYTSIIVFPSSSAFLQPLFKEQPLAVSPDSTRWVFENNLDNKYAITSTLFKEVALHLRMHTDSNGSRASCPPFLMRRNENEPMMIEFNCNDLESALSCDYLSACTGSRKSNEGKIGGWEMEDLGGNQDEHGYNQDVHSFQAKRLDWKEDVLNATNTIIFNSAGSYISSTLAATSLAALHGLDGASAGVCMNLYVTPAMVKTSAPPHTDKQDVVVVQTQGRKRWRVYSPPDSSFDSELDPFKRGKGTDSLTLEMLERENSELLLDVTLYPGDTLFVPARFPHTTDTLDCYDNEDDIGRSFEKEDWSMHLTVGLDSHVWNLNYISMRTLALRSHGIHDVLLQQTAHNFDRNMDMCVGRVNQLSNDLREGLYSSVDDTMLSFHSKNDRSSPKSTQSMEKLASNLLSFHDRTNLECGFREDEAQSLTFDQCLQTVNHFQYVGQKIANSHQDMYVAAVKEEQMRVNEEGGWARNVGNSMPDERARRLSIFRVPLYFQEMDMCREELRAWGDFLGTHENISPMILVGDQVESVFPTNLCREVDGEHPFNSAKVIKISSDGMLYDLQYFNGVVQKGVQEYYLRGPHGIGIYI
mmetsp:Transcript_18824/g.32099  ORF Transcript_18824/g.32099 Transcript_18824/m.32099 type:complete len:597 (+) Transcript_18824:105-1895(+)